MGIRMTIRLTSHMEMFTVYGTRRPIVWIQGQMSQSLFGTFRPLRLAFISTVNAHCHEVAQLYSNSAAKFDNSPMINEVASACVLGVNTI